MPEAIANLKSGQATEPPASEPHDPQRWLVGSEASQAPAPSASWVAAELATELAQSSSPVAGDTADTAYPSAWLPPTDREASASAAIADQPTDSTSLVSDRRVLAAHAYYDEICEQPQSDEVAAEALAAFATAAAEQASVDEPGGDEQLLRLTRTAAAQSLQPHTSRGGLRPGPSATLSAERECSCRETAVLLAERANGEIETNDDARLEHHLQRCAHCREVEQRFLRAERAFVATLAGAAASEAPAQAAAEPLVPDSQGADADSADKADTVAWLPSSEWFAAEPVAEDPPDAEETGPETEEPEPAAQATEPAIPPIVDATRSGSGERRARGPVLAAARGSRRPRLARARVIMLAAGLLLVAAVGALAAVVAAGGKSARVANRVTTKQVSSANANTQAGKPARHLRRAVHHPKRPAPTTSSAQAAVSAPPVPARVAPAAAPVARSQPTTSSTSQSSVPTTTPTSSTPARQPSANPQQPSLPAATAPQQGISPSGGTTGGTPAGP